MAEADRVCRRPHRFRHRGCHLSLLASRQPLRRILREREAEESAYHRRTTTVLCDAPIRARRHVESRQRHRLCAHAHGVCTASPARVVCPSRFPCLTRSTAKSGHRFPSFLPDGRHFVYTGFIGTCCPASKPARIRIGTLDTMDATTLMQVESSAVFASGHLLFNRDGTLMATPFDATALQFTGDAFPVAERVAREGSRYASFSVSDTGVLLYGSGGVGRATTRLTWMDRAGRALNTVGDPGMYENIAMSPDERRIAVRPERRHPENRDIWILDVARGRQATFTFDPGDDNCRSGRPTISASFSGDPGRRKFDAPPEAVGRRNRRRGGVSGRRCWPCAALRLVGRWTAHCLCANSRRDRTGFLVDLWVLPLFGDRKPFPLVKTTFANRTPRSLRRSMGRISVE